jgi:hypothetical protein
MFEPRRLHLGDLIVWSVIAAVLITFRWITVWIALALLFLFIGCAPEWTPPCDPYYAGNTKLVSMGCRPSTSQGIENFNRL